MFVMGNLLLAVATVVEMVLNIYMIIVIASALISWVNPDPYNPIVRFLRAATEPVLRPIRRRLPISGGLDFSPIIVILGIVFAKIFIVNTLHELARQMH